MRYARLVIASGLTAAALASVAAVALHRLPPAARLPTHWGADGRPDGFADAGIALFLPVAMTIGVSLIMAALPALEPLQDRLDRSRPLYLTAWGGLLALFALVEAMVAAPAFGVAPPSGTMLAGMGLFLVAIGNVLPKSRPGFFVGIRTPWAITDPDNWIATHRYGGRMMVAGGIAILALSVLPMPAETRGSFVTLILLVTVSTPVLYSFFYWRRARRA